jgi:hypothetical protein
VVEMQVKIPSESKDNSLVRKLWGAHHVDFALTSGMEDSLKIAREEGVLGPGTSFLVLDSLEQYLTHDIEPHPSAPFYEKFKVISQRKRQEKQLKKNKKITQMIGIWDRRIQWWNEDFDGTRSHPDYFHSLDPTNKTAMAIHLDQQVRWLISFFFSNLT